MKVKVMGSLSLTRRKRWSFIPGNWVYKKTWRSAKPKQQVADGGRKVERDGTEVC